MNGRIAWRRVPARRRLEQSDADRRYIYEMALMRSIFDASASELAMKCLATADGESHFCGHPNHRKVDFSRYRAVRAFGSLSSSHIQLTRIPAQVGEVGWHKVPERVLTVRLNGSAEYQTSDGETRYVPAGAFVLLEDGPHPPSAARGTVVIRITLPEGLDLPSG